MRFTLVAISLFFLSMTGCTLSQKKAIAPENPSLTLLQEQEQKLEDHALRLEALASTQDEMLRHLNTLQLELADINDTLKKQALAVPALPPVKSKPVSEDRIIRQTRPRQDIQGKAVLGRVEYVWLQDRQKYLKARIDTGAKSSALHATNIQPFERNSEKWVRFSIVLDEEQIDMEAPLEGHVKVRQTAEDELERRPVVKLNIQLGELKEETEFTLTDRSEMIYPVLLGRSFLQDIALVDVARKFTRKRDPQLKALAETKK